MNDVIRNVVELLRAGKDAEAADTWAAALSATPVRYILDRLRGVVSAIDASLGTRVVRDSTSMDGFPALLHRDARYQDAIHRLHHWKDWWGKGGSVFGAKLSSDSVETVRAAAIWRSSPLPRDAGSAGRQASCRLGDHAYLREDGGIVIELLDGSGPSNRPMVSTADWPEDLAELARQTWAAGNHRLVLPSIESDDALMPPP